VLVTAHVSAHGTAQRCMRAGDLWGSYGTGSGRTRTLWPGGPPLSILLNDGCVHRRNDAGIPGAPHRKTGWIWWKFGMGRSL